MATSNAYKPGWRSRRRSRLSLVERAVPRLGRIPASEDKSKPDTSSAPSKSTTFDSDQNAGGDDRSGPDVGVEPLVRSEEPAQQAEPPLTGPPLPPTLPSSVSPPLTESEEEPATEETAAEPAEGAETALAPGQDVGIELDAEDLTSDEVFSSEQAADQSSSTDLAPVVDKPLVPESDKPKANKPESGMSETAGPETSRPAIASKIIEGHWDSEDASVAADPRDEVDPRDEKDRVRLDWETLVSSGLVDPRDRARPLPANMDEIAKALVRQALSDQSSWRDRIILVSSARESRAKSMAALNFAFALTTIDRHSVVLLDANMDGSGAGRHLGAKEHPGLTTALCDSNVEVDEITFDTSLDRLTLVASGAYEEDILDRFASRRMLEILRFLTKDPETLLVLDAPPILSSQEAAVLSVIAGQVVLVVEAGTTDESSINQAFKRIGDRHNVSLVLSDHAGIDYDEPAVERPLPDDALPLPLPRKSASKRRLRRAIASFVVCIVLGLNVLLPGDQFPSDLNEREILLTETSILDRSTFKTKLMAPQTGGVAR